MRFKNVRSGRARLGSHNVCVLLVFFFLGWRSRAWRAEKTWDKKRGGKTERRGKTSSRGRTTGGICCIYRWKFWTRFVFEIASMYVLWSAEHPLLLIAITYIFNLIFFVLLLHLVWITPTLSYFSCRSQLCSSLAEMETAADINTHM